MEDGPAVKCHYTTRHTCNIHPDCEWCMLGHTKATGACYTHKQAEYLPEKIYTCKKVLDDDEDVEVDAAEHAEDDDGAVATAEAALAKLVSFCGTLPEIPAFGLHSRL